MIPVPQELVGNLHFLDSEDFPTEVLDTFPEKPRAIKALL